jgi:hypothetical protein
MLMSSVALRSEKDCAGDAKTENNRPDFLSERVLHVNKLAIAYR